MTALRITNSPVGGSGPDPGHPAARSEAGLLQFDLTVFAARNV